MRKVRAIGLLALLVVGVTAAMGAATASASSEFAASSYPVTVNGTANGPQELNAGNYPGECQLALSGGYLPGPQEGISLDPSGKCTAFGVSHSLNANGCKFELNPDWNTYAIGPKGCGPMTVQLFTCNISIPSQQGLSAEFSDVAGSPQKIRFASTTNHLKYSKSGCGASSTSEGGSLLGSWNLATRPMERGLSIWKLRRTGERSKRKAIPPLSAVARRPLARTRSKPKPDRSNAAKRRSAEPPRADPRR